MTGAARPIRRDSRPRAAVRARAAVAPGSRQEARLPAGAAMVSPLALWLGGAERGVDRRWRGLVAGERNQLRVPESRGGEHFDDVLRRDGPGHAVGPRPAARLQEAEGLRKRQNFAGDRMMAPFEITQSAASSSRGAVVISRQWTATLPRPMSRADASAFAAIAGVRSIPIARPVGPTRSAAMHSVRAGDKVPQ